MPQQASITVIIPVYNGALYLAEALNSVLQQTFSPSQVVVIDDGSTDDSSVIAREFGAPIHYVYQTNQGIGAARNHGVREATSEWIAFLDADDLWIPEKLELQIKAWGAAVPSPDMIMGGMIQFISPEMPDEEAARYQCQQTPQAGYHAGTLLIRRDRFLEAGCFKPDLKSGEFIEWLMRARALGLKELVIPEVVMKRRIHGSNYTLRQESLNQGYLDMVKHILQSRNKQNPS